VLECDKKIKMHTCGQAEKGKREVKERKRQTHTQKERERELSAAQRVCLTQSSQIGNRKSDQIRFNAATANFSTDFSIGIAKFCVRLGAKQQQQHPKTKRRKTLAS